MKHARTPLTGLLALGAALAMPLAFAQEPTTQAPPAGAAQPPAAEGQVTWADLDTDGNGNLSKQEAGAHSALSTVFDQADTDGDGQLTPDEYRAFAASQGAGPTGEN